MVNAASLAQIDAADPDSSVWLSANAGSGKTRVLIDRVARLLLDGVDPLHILCLTYTKAAATEMQNRLFARLGQWAMLDDAALDAALLALGVGLADLRPVDAETRARARRLFARAIETPGGLKIQTIHSFCATLLRRFPLEAGVTPRFKEIEERAAKLLRDEVASDVADGDQGGLFLRFAQFHTGSDFARLLAAIAQHRGGFSVPVDRDQALALMGLPSGFDQAALLAEVFAGDEPALAVACAPALSVGGVTDRNFLAAMQAHDLLQPDMAALATLENAVLGKAAPFAAKVDALPTKPARQKLGTLLEPLHAFMRRIETGRARRMALMAAEQTLALHEFAVPFLAEYAARKAQRGWLDFDDLVLKARDLLTSSSVAQWVLYRLDGGIDHILVDEAQDTSPAQWDLIRSLTTEFTAGLGRARARPRTVFVVGDKKQSIFSFMGADLAGLERAKVQVAGAMQAAGLPFQTLLLEYSFRSSPAVLRLVDLTFRAGAAAGLGLDVSHLPFHADLPGRVDLWPVVPALGKGDPPDWYDPRVEPSDEHHIVRLAEGIADHIAATIDGGTLLPTPTGARRVTAGDFLILVQGRTQPLFAEVIRACKARGLPVAGADRLKLGAELAVRDIGALLSFLDTPEDDLSLAAVLRSPLCGWSEDQLYRLAATRQSSVLWPALVAVAQAYPDTFAFLTDLRDQADFLRPYDLIERILIRHGGRARLLARLGAEADDGIDVLLAQAQDYERTEVPSLTGFLVWLNPDEVEVKRRMDAKGPLIRVMTVHGAKGLESPIVILPDTAQRKAPPKAELLVHGSGAAVWNTTAGVTPDPIKVLQDTAGDREAQERLRLLYVAMTRAETWLIVAAAGKVGTEGEGKCWYDLIAAGMERAGAVLEPALVGLAEGGLRLSHGTWPVAAAAVEDGSLPQPPVLPPADRFIVPPRDRPLRPVSPSQLRGAKFLAGDMSDGDTSDGDTGPDAETPPGTVSATVSGTTRGTGLHLLLETLPGLPADTWAMAADHLLAPVSDDPVMRARLLDEASALLADPSLAHVFGPDSLAEVAISATLEALDGRRVTGTIDRLVLSPDKVLVVDFKSNRVVPATALTVPDGIVVQLAAYRAAVAQIYPDRRVDAAVLWTGTGQIMLLDAAVLDAALVPSVVP